MFWIQPDLLFSIIIPSLALIYKVVEQLLKTLTLRNFHFSNFPKEITSNIDFRRNVNYFNSEPGNWGLETQSKRMCYYVFKCKRPENRKNIHSTIVQDTQPFLLFLNKYFFLNSSIENVSQLGRLILLVRKCLRSLALAENHDGALSRY